jgi:hypothetical protein
VLGTASRRKLQATVERGSLACSQEADRVQVQVLQLAASKRKQHHKLWQMELEVQQQQQQRRRQQVTLVY